MATKAKATFRQTVALEACLTRDKPLKDDRDYSGWVKELFVDQEGILAAQGDCDDQFYVCKIEEFPEVIDWLTKTYDAHKKNKGHR